MSAISKTEADIARNLRRPYFDPIRIEGNTIISSLITALPYIRGALLDLGCGDMPYAELVKDRIDSYIGTDLRPPLDKPPSLCADSLHLPFKLDSFDTILVTQVLEHVRNPFDMMKEIRRVLKPEGYAIFTLPAAWPLHEEPYDFFRYTKYGLAELAGRNDLEVIELEERGGGIAAIGQLAAAVLYDVFGSKRITRVPIKFILAPILSLCRIMDRFFYYPKFTLGYLLVVRKPK